MHRILHNSLFRSLAVLVVATDVVVMSGPAMAHWGHLGDHSYDHDHDHGHDHHHHPYPSADYLLGPESVRHCNVTKSIGGR